MKQRLFLAIPLPDGLTAACLDYGRSEKGRWPGSRWTAADNLHVTVCFFGDVDDAVRPGLDQALAAVAARTEPFELKPEGAELAPPGRRQPTMIWGVFAPSAAFERLTAAIREAAGPFAPNMPPAKAARPHVTLARFREGAFAPPGLSASPLRSPIGSFVAGGCELFVSRLTPSGPVYTRLQRLPFGG